MNIIITGASGSGKSSVINYLKEKYNIPLSISYTTRNKRENEKNGVDYNFITKQDFQNMIQNNKLEEFTIFNDNFYGTPKLSDKDFLFDLEFEGVLYFKKSIKNCIFIYIEVEKAELERRLINRGASNEEIKNRMIKFSKFENLKNEFKFDLCVNNNRTLMEALIEIEKFLKNKGIF